MNINVDYKQHRCQWCRIDLLNITKNIPLSWICCDIKSSNINVLKFCTPKELEKKSLESWWDCISKRSHWCVWLILAHPWNLSSNPSSFHGNLPRKQMIHWNDKPWDIPRLHFSHYLATTAAQLHAWIPKAWGKEDQKLGVSTVFFPTSISPLHGWSLPRLKRIDGFRLPPWLTFTLCVFRFKESPIYPTNL